MKRIISFIILCTMLLSSLPFFTYAEDFVYTSIASKEEWELLTELNAYRIENGKAPVTMLIGLQDACGVRAKELLSSLSHYRPDGTPWYSILENNKIDYDTDSFEIIASNFTDSKALLSALSNQEINNERLLSDYTHIGIGYSTSAAGTNLSSFCLIALNCSDAPVYELCNTENIHLNYGDTADKIDIALKRSCSHGIGYMKVLPSMIEGHDPSSIGTKVLFAKADTASLPFYIINDYSDSKPGTWYYDAVLACTDNGFFSGTGKGEFNVNGQMTREMFVTVLGRFSEIEPNEYPGSSFEDVKEDQWYSPYIEWAAQNGIVSGNGKGKFNGSGAITRQEICVILCNYISKYEISLDQKNAASDFADSDEISDWALEAVTYCQTRDIVSGNNKSEFMPINKATRAEVSVIFDNFNDSVNETAALLEKQI